MSEEKLTLLIIDDCIEQPNYESHRRGKNWVASVQRNLQAPGGLDRTFWDRRGPYAVVPSDLSPGQWIECGGDYYSGGGNPTRNRLYYWVEGREKDRLLLRPVEKKEVERFLGFGYYLKEE